VYAACLFRTLAFLTEINVGRTTLSAVTVKVIEIHGYKKSLQDFVVNRAIVFKEKLANKKQGCQE
jgi:hypothetical protein